MCESESRPENSLSSYLLNADKATEAELGRAVVGDQYGAAVGDVGLWFGRQLDRCGQRVYSGEGLAWTARALRGLTTV